MGIDELPRCNLSRMKGIILAGGLGTRLSPLTIATNKHLLPVFDKPMVYYPIATLMLAGIQDILIITNPEDLSRFEDLLASGDSIGVNFTYLPQVKPSGIPEAFIIAENFIAGGKCSLILGDNLFHGPGLGRALADFQEVKGVQAFGYEVKNPSDYGVAELDARGEVINISEKPGSPKSRIAVAGLYFFDEHVVKLAKGLVPSKRGELEITDLLMSYLATGDLHLSLLPRGTTWLDMGTFEKLQDAANYVRIIQERTGSIIGNLKEISAMQGWI